MGLGTVLPGQVVRQVVEIRCASSVHDTEMETYRLRCASRGNARNLKRNCLAGDDGHVYLPDQLPMVKLGKQLRLARLKAWAPAEGSAP